MSMAPLPSLLRRALPLALLLALLLPGAPPATGSLPPAERQALVDVFGSLGGKEWRNGTGAGWLVGDPCENRWYGVTCNTNSTHVIELYPSQVGSGNALHGTIPSSIGDLVQLQHLVLTNAMTHTGKLEGSIPPSFGSLAELRCVYLSHSRLSGSLPPSLSKLTKLQGFFARDNALSGVLPDVRGWSDLRSIDLDTNEKISGDLSGLGQLKKLAVVVIHGLKLSGTLPATLCGVFECDAYANDFSCPLPVVGNASSPPCCGVKTCRNGSNHNMVVVPTVSVPRRLQADPGDKRPYGPGYSCHCHTPPPQLHPQLQASQMRNDDFSAVTIGTHVLVDQTGLDLRRTNSTFTLHRPVKDPNNPILREDKPWEDRLHMFGSVVQASDDVWRIYYLVDGKCGLHNCVAESRDGGVTWTKPDLGLVTWGAAANVTPTNNNNIIGAVSHNLTSKDYFGWIGRNEDPHDTDSSRRFVATLTTPSWFKNIPAACTPFGPTRRDAAYVAFSADGLTFRMPKSTECYLTSKDDSQNPIVWFANRTLWYNRHDEMGASRGCAEHVAGPQRRVGVARFDTLITPPAPGKWPDRPTVLTFDAKDPPCMDLYTSNACAYEDAILAFPTPFLHTPALGLYPDGGKVGSDGPLWTRFASSRDPMTSLEYSSGDRSPWIARGAGVFNNVSKTYHGAWDAGMAFAFQGMVHAKSFHDDDAAVDLCLRAGVPAGATALTREAWTEGCDAWDELQQYYFGTQGTHHTQSKHYGNSSNGIGRVTIRRDGFASHHAASTPSLVVTEPLVLPSCDGGADLVLMLNVKVATYTGGGVRISLAATDESELPNFELGVSNVITGDFVRAVASWRGSSVLNELSGRAVVMTLQLQFADLYAWEWRCL